MGDSVNREPRGLSRHLSVLALKFDQHLENTRVEAFVQPIFQAEAWGFLAGGSGSFCATMEQRGFLGLGFKGKGRDVVSFNLVFHVASALTCLLLIYALLRLQSLVRFHGQLWQSLNPSRRAVHLDWPSLFLEKFGQALDIPVQSPAEKGLAQKIMVESWVRAHLDLGIEQIIWQSGSSLQLITRNQDQTGLWPEKLEKALGGQIKVQLKSIGKELSKGDKN